MIRYNLVKNTREISYKNRQEICEGCTLEQMNQEPETLKSFADKDEALEALREGADGDLEFTGDVLEFSQMPQVNDYVDHLNALQAERRQACEDLYEEYGDHTDDAELAWSQRREEYDAEIDQLVDEAREAGCLVHWDNASKMWKGVYIPE